MVRVAPNELAFTTPSSFRDIYAFRKGHGVFVKSPAYDAAAFTEVSRSTVNEQDPTEHARMRKMLAPAFSDRSLRDQWPLIHQVTESFIKQMEKGAGSGQPVDLAMYFSLITFDVATNLGLGESFNTVETGRVHPWAVFFMNGVRAMGLGVVLLRFPWLRSLILALKPPQIMAMIKELKTHETFCVELVKKYAGPIPALLVG